MDTSTEGLGNITLSGEQTLNGLLTSTSRVLVTEQTLPEENGIYDSAAGAWTRTADADGSPSSEVSNGNLTHVLNSGSTKFKFKYLLVSPDPIVVGTDAQDWEEHNDIDFGTTAGTATEGNDSRVPTQDENDALVGASGIPSAANPVVLDSDSRNTDARTPTAHGTTHNPGAADPITTAVAGTIAVGDVAAEGAAGSVARSDHKHALPAPAAPADVTKTAAAAGAATTVARADHKHDIATAAPSQGVGGGNTEGSSTSMARADHDHTIRTTTGPTDLTVGAVADGEFLKRDGTAIVGASAGGTQLFEREVNAADHPSVDPALAKSRSGHAIIRFAAGVDRKVIFYVHISNDYTGGDITVDFDWVAETATSGDVVIGGRFERNNAGGQNIDSDGFAAQKTVISTANGTNGVGTRASITYTNAEADSPVAGDIMRFEAERVGTSGSDNMTGGMDLRGSVSGRQ